MACLPILSASFIISLHLLFSPPLLWLWLLFQQWGLRVALLIFHHFRTQIGPVVFTVGTFCNPLLFWHILTERTDCHYLQIGLHEHAHSLQILSWTKAFIWFIKSVQGFLIKCSTAHTGHTDTDTIHSNPLSLTNIGDCTQVQFWDICAIFICCCIWEEKNAIFYSTVSDTLLDFK